MKGKLFAQGLGCAHCRVFIPSCCSQFVARIGVLVLPVFVFSLPS